MSNVQHKPVQITLAIRQKWACGDGVTEKSCDEDYVVVVVVIAVAVATAVFVTLSLLSGKLLLAD